MVERGLKSIAAAREERSVRRFGKPTTLFWMLLLGGVSVALLVAYVTSSRELEASRSALLSKQRAAAETIGKEWFPLRDQVERVALEAAMDPYPGDMIAKEAASWDFRALPGLYLRLRTAQARDAAALRRAAASSQKDGFTACLLRRNTPWSADAGAAKDHPWNLRQAYASTRILTDEWLGEVKAAENDMRLRVFEQQYARARDTEIPLAIEIVKRAQFFLLVLDEDSDEARTGPDGGAPTSEDLQLVLHPTRVFIVNLRTRELLARLRRSVEGQFFMAGERAADPETQAALRRQVNNCALAQIVSSEISPAK